MSKEDNPDISNKHVVTKMFVFYIPWPKKLNNNEYN